MQRREVIRLLVAFGFAPEILVSQQGHKFVPPPPAPVPWTLGLNENTPLPHTSIPDEIAEEDLRFFSAAQMASLRRLCVLMMPATSVRPGAVEAEVPAFLDFLIGISPEPRRQLYTGGLDWLDAASRKQHNQPFAKTSDAEADALVKPWLRTWMTDHPPTEPHADFVNIALADIRMATINSEPWSRAEARDGHKMWTALYWSPIEPDVYAKDFSNIHYRPSPAGHAHTVDAPRSEHTTAPYPR